MKRFEDLIPYFMTADEVLAAIKAKLPDDLLPVFEKHFNKSSRLDFHLLNREVTTSQYFFFNRTNTGGTDGC